MQQGLPRPIELRTAPPLSSEARARLVALLAAGLERLLTAQGRKPRLDLSAELCVYTDDAEPPEDADG